MGAYDDLKSEAVSCAAKRPAFVPSTGDPEQLKLLAEHGVSASLLSQSEIQSLDNNGFLILPGLLSEDTCRKIEQLVVDLETKEGDAAGADHELEAGVVRIGNLIAKDTNGVCRALILHPKILAAVSHVFTGRSFLLDSFTSRRVLPGMGLQPLHRDLNIYQMRAVNCMVALSPFTAKNGATRLIPGTHQQPLPPHRALEGGMASWLKKHPDEILAIAPRGSVIINNPQTWHAGTRNDTVSPRLGCHFGLHECVPMNVATQSSLPRSVIDKNYSESEQKMMKMLIVGDEEYERRRSVRKPEMWPELDQSGWERGGEARL